MVACDLATNAVLKMLRFSIGEPQLVVPEIDPASLSASLAAGEELFLLDVREPHELDISCLEGAVNIPLGQLAFRLDEIPGDQAVVVICRTGSRSGQATEMLAEHGHRSVRNLAGGMNAWAQQVDPSVRTY